MLSGTPCARAGPAEPSRASRDASARPKPERCERLIDTSLGSGPVAAGRGGSAPERQRAGHELLEARQQRAPVVILLYASPTPCRIALPGSRLAQNAHHRPAERLR